MVALVKKSYRKVFPMALRAKLWTLRDSVGWAVAEPREVGRYLSSYLKRRCEVCLGGNLTQFTNSATTKLSFRFYQCRDCEYIFVWPPPDTPTSSYYDGATMPDFGEGEGRWNDHYLAAIDQHAGSPGRILEIGFGNASFLRLAHEHGWLVHGTDLSQPQVERARDELRLPNIELGTVESLRYGDGYFDVICGFNFLEHVPHPRKTLEKIFRLLKPGGVVAVMCPNISGIFHLLMPEILGDNDPLKISWCPPDHISYFNKGNLRMLLESIGFEHIADESKGMSSLWRQFEPQIGPDVTAAKLKQLALEIRSSQTPVGVARVDEYREEIKKKLVERMTWTMVSDLIELEPLLGAEVGVFFVGKKPGEENPRDLKAL